MGETVIGALLLIAVFALTQFGMALRIRNAGRRTVEDLQRQKALDEASAVSLPYGEQRMFKIGLRDFRPKALESLVQAGIVGRTLEGKFYLKRTDCQV